MEPNASTRQRILDAALVEFATYGIAGSRIDRIAESASANKESIYRYYGSKNKLLERVLHEYLTKRDDVMPTGRLQNYPADLFRLYRHSPEFLRLSAWEGLELGGRLGDDAVERRSAHFERKLDAVRAAQEAGDIDPSIDPRHLMIVLLGMSNYWFVVPQIVRLLFGGEPDSSTYVDHERFLSECAQRLLAPPDNCSEDPDRERRMKALIKELHDLM